MSRFNEDVITLEDMLAEVQNNGDKEYELMSDLGFKPDNELEEGDMFEYWPGSYEKRLRKVVVLRQSDGLIVQVLGFILPYVERDN